MADSGLVDAAVMELLANDAELSALCPDGVYWGVRNRQGGRAFVIVGLGDHTEKQGLAGITLYERTVYTVRATIHTNSRAQPRQAAARIHALLHGALLDLTAAGYVAMNMRRVERIALPDADPANSALWYHTGGQYELVHYPL